MIPVLCRRCGEELTEPGALAFGLPVHGWDRVVKHHICKECWTKKVLPVIEGAG